LVSGLNVLVTQAGREHDDGKTPQDWMGPNVAQNFDAIGDGHVDIENEQVGKRVASAISEWAGSFKILDCVFAAENAMKGMRHPGLFQGDRGTAHELVYIPAIPGVATFLMKGSSFYLPKGMTMLWTTGESKGKSIR